MVDASESILVDSDGFLLVVCFSKLLDALVVAAGCGHSIILVKIPERLGCAFLSGENKIVLIFSRLAVLSSLVGEIDFCSIKDTLRIWLSAVCNRALSWGRHNLSRGYAVHVSATLFETNKRPFVKGFFRDAVFIRSSLNFGNPFFHSFVQ